MHNGGLRQGFARLELQNLRLEQECSIWRASTLNALVMAHVNAYGGHTEVQGPTAKFGDHGGPLPHTSGRRHRLPCRLWRLSHLRQRPDPGRAAQPGSERRPCRPHKSRDLIGWPIKRRADVLSAQWTAARLHPSPPRTPCQRHASAMPAPGDGGDVPAGSGHAVPGVRADYTSLATRTSNLKNDFENTIGRQIPEPYDVGETPERQHGVCEETDVQLLSRTISCRTSTSKKHAWDG